MGAPIFVVRLRVTNGGGTFDSLAADTLEQPRIVFDVTKSLSDSPNTATIEIYNLAPTTVALIQGVVKTRIDWTPAERAELLAAGASAEPAEVIADTFGFGAVELSWGYVDSEEPDIEAALRVGFVGQSSSMRVQPSGTDRVLVIEATDGGSTLGAASAVQRSGGGAAAYRSKSYAPGTNATDVIVDLVRAMGLSADAGQIEQLLTSALLARGLPPGDLILAGGYTSSGPALPLLQQFLRSLDLRWSIQDGQLLILAPDGVIPGLSPLRLETEAGNIVGEPETVEGGRLAISTWADASAVPGRQVDVLTERIDASYRADQVTTSGDSYSGGQTDLLLDALQIIPGVV